MAIIATCLSAFVSLGFSIASVVSSRLIVPGAEKPQVGAFAGYALSRWVAIAVAIVFASTRRTVHSLLAVGWIACAIQALDVLVGISQGDVTRILGPAVLAGFSAYAMIRLGKQQSVILASTSWTKR